MGKTRDIREAVEKELSYDPRVDATDISVKNIKRQGGPHRHRAQLSPVPGSGPVGLARRRGEGYPTNLRNEIGVVSGVEPTGLEQLVRMALGRSALVPDDSDVHVDTSGSTIILTGHVRTRAERDAIVGATWMARGVAMVVDELEVTG